MLRNVTCKTDEGVQLLRGKSSAVTPEGGLSGVVFSTYSRQVFEREGGTDECEGGGAGESPKFT